jgi:hypothetical protein
MKMRGMLAGFALLAAAGMSACSASPTTASAGNNNGQTTSPAATATTSATTTPSATATPTPTSSPTFVAMQTPTGGEFLSPSGNISCEVDYHHDGLTHAYCQTATPPQSVSMGVTGSYSTCAGEQCLGNAGMGTPTLAYGQETGVGPFICESARTGVTCTAGGRGFHISRSGITRV